MKLVLHVFYKYLSQQITSLLTIDELKLLNPTLWLVPRTFILKPGHSLLLGGLGRVDYLEVDFFSMVHVHV